MRIRKSIVVIFLSLLTMALSLPVPAFAAGSIDYEEKAILTINYQDNGSPLVGAAFDIYLIATVDENGELTTTETFSDFNVNIYGENDDAWITLASTIEGYILRDDMTPVDSGKTDEQGILVFPKEIDNLEAGLYLIMGYRHTQNGYVYESKPSMVLLPSMDKNNNEQLYEVTVNPKYESKPEQEDRTITRKVLKIWEDDGYEKERPQEVVIQLLRDGEVYDTVTLNDSNNWRYTWTELDDEYRWSVVERELEGYSVEVTREGITFVVTNTYDEDITGDSPTDETSTSIESKLPQTGLLWWPIPVLIAAGLVLVIVGLVRRRGK